MDFVIYALMAFLAGALMGFLKEYKAVVRASSFLGFIASAFLFFQVVDVYINGALKTNILGIPISIDSLSNLFLLVVSLIGMASSLFSVNYMDYYEKKGKGWVYALTFNTFIMSMAFIVIVNSFEWFVFFWELMTLSSFILVFFSEEKKDIDASLKYYITMHFLNTFPLFLSLGIAYSLVGSFSKLTFPVIAAALAAAPLITKATFTILLLITFMTKAGVAPFHYWLPDAHPAAPSNVSALLSGTMIKVAVYGLVRSVFTIIGPSAILGYTIASLGTITLIVGTLYALRETIGKRLLAYHSVGQMGYIWLGIGIGAALIPKGGVYAAIGALGLFAGLFHVLNHAIFKGSLFLSAGAIIYATGEKDLNNLGGLGRYMKATALAALFASLAISGIPPFNGFLSKWLIYIAGYYSTSLLLAIGAVMAVFISAATLASFMKFYSAPFGGEMPEEKPVKEVPLMMLAGQWLLAGLALLIGVFPRIVVPLVNLPAGAPLKLTLFTYGYSASTFIPLYFAGLIVVLSLATYALLKPRETVKAKPWDCGSTYVEEGEYKVKADGYYLWFEQKIGSFYRFTDWAYSFGYSILKYIVKSYLWIARFFVKIVDTPYTKVESIEEIREHEVMYIDEEVFKPLVRFIKVAGNVLSGVRLGKFIALTVILVVVIGILFALL
ncbi:MAG: hypothetical protein F7B59_05385 [Desulfurococcales archaeon]|nr:hypothetical protein [Desulfurococcales archaeon]